MNYHSGQMGPEELVAGAGFEPAIPRLRDRGFKIPSCDCLEDSNFVRRLRVAKISPKKGCVGVLLNALCVSLKKRGVEQPGSSSGS